MVIRVVDSLKDNVSKVVIGTVDHLGSIASKLDTFLDEKVDEFSATKLRFSCIEQESLCVMRSGDRTAAGQRQGPTAMQSRAFDPHVCVQVGPFIISISMFEIAVWFRRRRRSRTRSEQRRLPVLPAGVEWKLGEENRGLREGVVSVISRRQRASSVEIEQRGLAGCTAAGGNDRSDAEVTALVRKVVHRGESAPPPTLRSNSATTSRSTKTADLEKPKPAAVARLDDSTVLLWLGL
nr:protein ABIL2-like isoform X1 [Ipomoea batatas]